jgi:hypothetical protein
MRYQNIKFEIAPMPFFRFFVVKIPDMGDTEMPYQVLPVRLKVSVFRAIALHTLRLAVFRVKPQRHVPARNVVSTLQLFPVHFLSAGKASVLSPVIRFPQPYEL